MSITTLRPRPTFAALLISVIALLAGSVSPAQAAYVQNVTNASPTAKDAMAYSDFKLSLTYPSDSSPKSMTVDLPKGQLGALQNATFCTDAQWKSSSCPATSQIGNLQTAATGAGINVNTDGGIYRLNPTGTELGRIGMIADAGLLNTPLYIEGFLRLRDDGSYGIRATVPLLPNKASAILLGNVTIDIKSIDMTLLGRVPSTGNKGFFFNPAECITATTTVSSVAYDNQTATSSANYTPINCNTAPYNPSINFTPASSPASTPTAFGVSVNQPYVATDAKVASPFKSAVVTLPDGVQLSGAANSDGSLVACTDAQFSYGDLSRDNCPAGSKVGSVVMDSPLVGSIPGDVYLAQPSTGANNLVRLFMVAEQGSAVDSLRVKLLADVSIDPTTGRQIATLTNLPAQPVKSFAFSFRAGTNPGTRQPRMCGTYSGSGVLTSYSSPTAATRTGNYVVDTSCPAAGRFRPTIAMTNTPNTAGSFATGVTTIDLPVGDEPMTKLTASLPPGMIAQLSGTTRCTAAQVTADTCPAASKIGTVLDLAGQSTVPGTFSGDIYLTDAPDTSSVAGLYIKVPVIVGPINISTLKISSSLRLRSDFGIDVVSDIPDTVRKLQLDNQRLQLTFNKANFLLNPPVCTGNTIAGAFTSSLGTSASANSAVTITGCGALLFQPTLAFAVSPASAGGASSLTATVTQPASATGALQSPPKSISVALPDGVSLSPSANSDAALVGCSDAQFSKNDLSNPTCPAGSSVGSTVIQTPSIGRLAGTVYLADSAPGHTARIFIDAKSDDYGAAARVKLEGFIDVDPATGKTTTVFNGIPPVNFTSFALTLRGGINPVLSMPRTCGTYSGGSTMVPYSGANATPGASITLNANCTDAASFAPTLAVATSPTTAGTSTTLTTTINVPERHRQLDNINLSLPAGMLANINGITRCTVAAATAGTCAAASKIGTVTAAAGQGTTPGAFAGSLYLTDAPTAGDVVGIAVDLAAVVGPIDLGHVITLASVKLRPADYGIDIAAAVPTDVKGIPLYLRQLKLTIDKAGFMTNPVTCAATNITSVLHSLGGSSVTPSVPYQATACASLGFNPAVSFTAAPSVAAGASSFTARVTAPASTTVAPQGALKKAVVDLPTGVSLSPSINSAGTLSGCTAAQFAQTTFADPTCAATTVIGTASIDVPQVGTLTGNIHLAQATPAGAIAGLFLDAKSTQFGAPVRVKLDGRVDVDATTGKTTAMFDNAPAVAFTSFSLAMRGGTAPAISVPRTCGTPSGAATLTPQTGVAVARTATLTIDTSCGNDTAFAPTGSTSLSDLRAGQDTQLTTTVNVPSGNRELGKVTVSLPAGLLANVNGKTRCAVAAAQAGTCTAASAIGTVSADAGQGTNPGTFSGGTVYLTDAPTTSDIVGLGLSIPVQVGPIDLGTVNVLGSVKLRSDYGIDISADVPTQVKGIPMYLRKLTIAITKSNLLFNPSSCGAKTTNLAFSSVSYSGNVSTATGTSSQTIAQCDQLAFDPSVAFSAAPAKAGGSGAFTTTISLPAQPQSALKSTTVQLPDGMSLSPSLNSAGTLVGCSDAQFAEPTTMTSPTCPALSKIGDVTIQTASVGTLAGEVFLAATAPGHVARVFLHAQGTTFPTVHVKVSGFVDSNATTGVASATFSSLPDVPFTQFAIAFKGGDAPAISMPRTCGTTSGSASLTGQAGNPAVSRSGSLTIDQSCTDAASFAPTMGSVVSPTTAGASSTLTTTVNVPERHRALDQLTLNLPAGLLANVSGAARCTIVAANASACPAATKIGSVTAKAGQGNTLGAFSGSLYLTDGPTAGDVVGIAVDLPAVVGPVDLGHVITIASVKLRPADYGIDVTADVPTSVQGIPLHLRQMVLTVDKAGFLTNPVTCGATNITSLLHSVGGSTATPSVPFQATGCASLGFSPSVAFSAAPATAAGASAFTATISAPASTSAAPQGALKKAVVDLPTGVSLSPSINSAGTLTGCTAGQFAQTTFADPTCPATSNIGAVTIAVPQVGNLTGNVYLAQTTPSGAIAGLSLDAKSTQFGGNVRVKLDGRVDVDASTGKTTATFDSAPAIAFTSFSLTLQGGTAPAISVPRVCGTPSGAASLTPQSGTAVSRTATLTINAGCGNDTAFAPTGSVALGDLRAGQDTSLTATINVPSGNRELAKVAISLPAGLLAKIDGLPRCTVAAAQAGTCAAATELGTVSADAGQGTVPGTFAGKAYLVDAPTAADMVAIGLSIPVQVGPIDLGKVNVVAPVRLRSDYGLDISADVPTQVKGIPIYLRKLTIAVNKAGFMFNPSTCSAKTSTIAMTSASYAGATSTGSATSSQTITQCDQLAFNPSVGFSANPAKAGGAAAFTTSLSLPATPAQSALKSAVVQLPAGVSLSPSIDSAGTLTGCTDAQFVQATPATTPTCPAASQIGSTSIQTGSVGTLTGEVFLAATAPGHLARVFVHAASTAFPGAHVKMAGFVDVDAATGIASADFSGAPEVPFTQFDITFRGGSNPALSMPRTCGTPSGSAVLSSHAGGTPVSKTASLTISANCAVASTFTPTATVTSSPTTAAANTALSTKISVPEGQGELSRVRLSLPAGVLAKIDGHARCSIAAANAGTCAAASRVGVITAKAGQGDTPAPYAGTVYLTDAPGAGDLVGLAVELPVQVGKVGTAAIVDLGKVTSIGGVSLRTDYGIDIDMPVPTSIKGIPMVLRELTLTINDSNFMVNPPTCSGNAVTGTLNSAQSGNAAISTALAIDNCTSATFNPSVAFSATPATPAAAAAFKSEVTLPATPNQSPVKTAAVTLPAGVSLTASANANGDLVGCTDAQFAQNTWNDPTCPAGSKVGTVTIQTPSVGAVTGDAYLAATAPGGAIARLMIDAKSTTYGSKARIKVDGPVSVDATTGSTTATFNGLPPVAFTSFALTLRGGSSPVVSLPRTCGTFAGSGTLTPHAGTTATRAGSLVLDTACPPVNQFGPQVAFNLSPNDAGAAGKLDTTITVPGADQELSKVRLDMPEGLTAKLKGAARCTIAQAQSDTCAANTQVGTVSAKVGVAGAPYSQSGKVYLTDGRAGNVAGMAIILPAVVGPIDLGKVITIADVQLRSPDLALQITADVPTTQLGVRLDLRELKLSITKDDFLVNPSSCGTLTGTGTFTSKGARTATGNATITVPPASCVAQNFSPQVSFAAGNPKPGEASDFTTSVSLTNDPGPESPFKSVSIRLPEGTSVSASAGARGDLGNGCSDAQFKQDDLASPSTCPAGSEIGTVRFETDLVGDLTGKAYLAPSSAGNLARIFLETTAVDVPNLTVRVVGEVKVNPTTGATDAVFDEVPAIPVTKFVVMLRGGDAPVIALPRLCGTASGTGTFVPVNGSSTKTSSASLVLNTGCPDVNAFVPTTQLDRSTTAAGRSMTFTTTVNVPAKQQELSSLSMSLPAGLLGTISSVPACPLDDAKANACAASTKVGDVSAQVGVASAPFTVNGAAFLVKGDSDSIARLAIVLPAKVGPVDLGNVITIAELKLRADYGLDISAPEIPTTVKGVRLDLHKLVLSINRTGFMVNPVSCAPANGVTNLGSAQGGTQQRVQSLVTDACGDLSLNATLGFDADPASPMVASSVTTKIRAAANSGAALDAMKNVRVTLPEGLSLSPSAGARGDLEQCTPAQFAGNSIDVDAACPAGARVGTVAINSPMVGVLSGDVFLGAKTDGHFSGIYLQAKAPDYPSLRVKLTGTLDVDETTGRLTAVFNDLPQVQVSSLDLTLRGGNAPVLSLPRTCGSFGADLNVQRHGGQTSDAVGSLTLDQDCPDAGAFAPTIDLSVNPSQAGANTALRTTVNVPARNQELASLDLAMPNGLLGRLTVGARCSVDAARANACGDDSLVGDVTAKVGVATAPYSVQGKVFLTEGFDGSIAGLMFALPARVGPIDLGNVVTLAQIKITGNDLQMRITAKDIPTRVKGIPLTIGQLGITIDKPGLVINASQCSSQRLNANFGSAQGAGASAGADYAATGCASLDWKPGLKASFSGPAAEVRTKGHPTLTTVITQNDGNGNLRTANVTLPDGIGTDLTNVNARLCDSAATAIAGNCPAISKIGTGEIITSALPEPVDASLYVVKVPGQTLPGIAIHVRDQIDFDIIGNTKLDKAGRIVASFDGLPDTPISKMTLVFNGGSTGILQLGKEICGIKGAQTDGVLISQHGVSKTFAVPVDCNGSAAPGAAGATESTGTALASTTFRPRGGSSGITFALSNPNGISKIVLKMPKGAIFTKKAYKLVKVSLTGAKAKVKVVNGERRLAISIKPTVPGTKVTKVKFKLPATGVKINIKVRKVLEDKKTSKKKKAKLLAKLLAPTITTTDANGKSATVKSKVKVTAK